MAATTDGSGLIEALRGAYQPVSIPGGDSARIGEDARRVVLEAPDVADEFASSEPTRASFRAFRQKIADRNVAFGRSPEGVRPNAQMRRDIQAEIREAVAERETDEAIGSVLTGIMLYEEPPPEPDVPQIQDRAKGPLERVQEFDDRMVGRLAAGGLWLAETTLRAAGVATEATFEHVWGGGGQYIQETLGQRLEGVKEVRQRVGETVRAQAPLRAETGTIEEIEAGIAAGFRNIGMGFASDFARMAYRDGNHERARHWESVAEEQQKRVEEFGIEPLEITDVGSVGDLLRWTSQSFAQQGPIVGMFAASGYAGASYGAMVGRFAGPYGAAIGAAVGAMISVYKVGETSYRGQVYHTLVQQGVDRETSAEQAEWAGKRASLASILVPAAIGHSLFRFLHPRAIPGLTRKQAIEQARRQPFRETLRQNKAAARQRWTRDVALIGGVGTIAEGFAEAVAEWFVIQAEEAGLGIEYEPEQRRSRILNAAAVGALTIGAPALGVGGLRARIKNEEDLRTASEAHLEEIFRRVEEGVPPGDVPLYRESLRSLGFTEQADLVGRLTAEEVAQDADASLEIQRRVEAEREERVQRQAERREPEPATEAQESVAPPSRTRLEEMRVREELRPLARQLGVPNAGTLRKSALVDRIDAALAEQRSDAQDAARAQTERAPGLSEQAAMQPTQAEEASTQEDVVRAQARDQQSQAEQDAREIAEAMRQAARPEQQMPALDRAEDALTQVIDRLTRQQAPSLRGRGRTGYSPVVQLGAAYAARSVIRAVRSILQAAGAVSRSAGGVRRASRQELNRMLEPLQERVQRGEMSRKRFNEIRTQARRDISRMIPGAEGDQIAVQDVASSAADFVQTATEMSAEDQTLVESTTPENAAEQDIAELQDKIDAAADAGVAAMTARMERESQRRAEEARMDERWRMLQDVGRQRELIEQLRLRLADARLEGRELARAREDMRRFIRDSFPESHGKAQALDALARVRSLQGIPSVIENLRKFQETSIRRLALRQAKKDVRALSSAAKRKPDQGGLPGTYRPIAGILSDAMRGRPHNLSKAEKSDLLDAIDTDATPLGALRDLLSEVLQITEGRALRSFTAEHLATISEAADALNHHGRMNTQLWLIDRNVEAKPVLDAAAAEVAEGARFRAKDLPPEVSQELSDIIEKGGLSHAQLTAFGRAAGVGDLVHKGMGPGLFAPPRALIEHYSETLLKHLYVGLREAQRAHWRIEQARRHALNQVMADAGYASNAYDKNTQMNETVSVRGWEMTRGEALGLYMTLGDPFAVRQIVESGNSSGFHTASDSRRVLRVLTSEEAAALRQDLVEVDDRFAAVEAGWRRFSDQVKADVNHTMFEVERMVLQEWENWYPVVRDRRFEQVSGIFSGRFRAHAPGTQQYFRERRGGSSPVVVHDFTQQGLHYIDSTSRYIAYARYYDSARRIVGAPQLVRAADASGAGWLPDYLAGWIVRQVNPQADVTHGDHFKAKLSRIARYLKRNVSMSIIGWAPTAMAKNPAGMAVNAARDEGFASRWMGHTGTAVAHIRREIAWAMENLPSFRERYTGDQVLVEYVSGVFSSWEKMLLGDVRPLKRLWGITASDKFGAVVRLQEAKHIASEAGLKPGTEAYNDRVDSEWWRLMADGENTAVPMERSTLQQLVVEQPLLWGFAPFISSATKVYALLPSMGSDLMRGRSKQALRKAAGYTVASIFLASVNHAFTSMRGRDDDDDRAWWKRYLESIALAFPGNIPIVGEITWLTYRLASGRGWGGDMFQSPALDAMGQATRGSYDVIRSAFELARGDLDRHGYPEWANRFTRAAPRLAESLAQIFGIPSLGPRQALEIAFHNIVGEAPESVWRPVYNEMIAKDEELTQAENRVMRAVRGPTMWDAMARGTGVQHRTLSPSPSVRDFEDAVRTLREQQPDLRRSDLVNMVRRLHRLPSEARREELLDELDDRAKERLMESLNSLDEDLDALFWLFRKSDRALLPLTDGERDAIMRDIDSGDPERRRRGWDAAQRHGISHVF